MKNSSAYIVIAILIFLAVAGLAYTFGYDHDAVRAPSDFEECANAGNPVMESYPRQCRAKDGRTFVEDVAAEPSLPGSSQTEPEPREGRISGGCAIGGCSAQICADANEAAGIITTCEYRADYACYQSARCERQGNGQCGWTKTVELTACLKNPPPLQ